MKNLSLRKVAILKVFPDNFRGNTEEIEGGN